MQQLPPGLGQQAVRHRSRSPDAETPRRATPTIPPGFDKPDPTPAEAFAANILKQRPGNKSRASAIAVVTPTIPISGPGRIGTPLKKEVLSEDRGGDDDNSARGLSARSRRVSGDDNAVTESEISDTQGKHPMERDDIVTDQALLPESVPGGAPRASTTESRGFASASETSEPSLANLKALSANRQAPGKFDIAAATNATGDEVGAPTLAVSKDGATTTKSSLPQTVTTSSRPTTPADARTESPVKRTIAPRTLRLVSTPKSENPPPQSTTSSTLPPTSTATMAPSRKTSIASINMPGTPSVDISDSVSITSTSLSISRASSPPPAKKTKSQVMRERKEKAAAKLAVTEEVALKKEDPVVGPIIGRKKKKERKLKEASITAKREDSRPATPDDEIVDKLHSDASPIVDTQVEQAQATQPMQSAQGNFSQSPTVERAEEKKTISASATLRDLQNRGDLTVANLEMLKANLANLSSHLKHDARLRYDNNDFTQILKPPKPFDEDTEAKFADRKSVEWQDGQQSERLSARNLITPAGTWLKMLSPEEEAHYLELESRLRAESKSNPAGWWQRSGIDEKLAQLMGANSSLPNIHRFYDSTFDPDQYTFQADSPSEPSSITPSTATTERPAPLLPSATDPFSAPPALSAANKAPSADEALQYVNQYVLPTVSLPHPQTGKPAEAIYLGSATPSANQYSSATAQAPGFIVENNSYRFVGVGGEPALVGSVGATANSATLSAAAAASSSRTQAAGYAGVGQGPETVDAWTAVHRLAGARSMGKVRSYGDWYEGSPVPELGWSGRMFANVAEMDRAWQESRRETEGLEKRLQALVKKNRRLVGLEKGGSGVTAH